MRRGTHVALLPILLLAVSGGASAVARSSSAPQTPADVSVLERFLAHDQRLLSYRAVRRLTATARDGRWRAELEAITTFDGRGFTYDIISEQGSRMICRRVLRAALDLERRTVEQGESRTDLTRDNYDFVGVGADADGLMRIAIRPRRNQVSLVVGSLLLHPTSAELIRVEGEPSQSPSFWTRHVRVVREYGRVDDIRVPLAMRSTAEILGVGSSTLEMTYRYTDINGKPVRH